MREMTADRQEVFYCLPPAAAAWRLETGRVLQAIRVRIQSAFMDGFGWRKRWRDWTGGGRKETPASAEAPPLQAVPPSPPAWKDWRGWIQERIQSLAPDAYRILEVGGDGSELGPLFQDREFHSIRFPEADVCRGTRFPDGHFHAVLTKMTFEHLYDPFGAAAEITRLLAPGGLLVVITVWSRRDRTAPGVEDYFRFSTAGLQQLFPRLEILECGYDLSGGRVDCRMDEVPVDDLGGWREHWSVYLTAKKPAVSASAAPAASRPFNLSVFQYPLERVLEYGDAIAAGEEAAAAVREVMELGKEKLDKALLGDGERGLPSEPRFHETGYSRMMLARYLVPGALLCRGLEVLDAGCGLGWGAYLLSRFAARVTAFDRDPAVVEFARSHWPADNIEWLAADALDEHLLAGRHFDAVTTMETVEHFSPPEAERFLALLASRLKAGGLLAGTSGFPKTREEAERLQAQNPHHAGIFTEEEFLALLRRHFSRAAVIGGWMFLAIR